MAIRISLLYILFAIAAPALAADSLTIFNILKQDTTLYIATDNGLEPIFEIDESWRVEKQEGIKANFTEESGEEWKFYLLLIVGLLIGITRLAYYKDFKELIDSFLNYNLANQFFRDWDASPPFSFLLFNLNYLIVISITIFLILNYYEVRLLEEDLLSIGIIFAMLLSLFVLRVIFFRFLNLIFSFGRELRLYSFHIGVIYKMMGLVLFPLVILFSFMPESYSFFIIPIFIVIIFSFLFYRYLRGMAVAKDYLRFYRFHFLLYICTLEIAPVLIFLKIITSYIQ